LVNSVEFIFLALRRQVRTIININSNSTQRFNNMPNEDKDPQSFESERARRYRLLFTGLFLFFVFIICGQLFVEIEETGSKNAGYGITQDQDTTYVNYNQSARGGDFKTPAELVKYVCEADVITFEPVCFW